ncbi:hypothetical protein SAMN04488118_1022 [Epibacterium ulvae]|uniref:Uncharacterized protein n=1 Tax=Epibacterium ulvae TaxID=1156985 RepID=A0A1G5PS65_9RHOB|nr:hypothetical protein SAMN04488118_1012 [Epibacterium ulvae]SCZ52465.1 hypothetical protein SAMN04488118_1022 [Epibacterium ulvae]
MLDGMSCYFCPICDAYTLQVFPLVAGFEVVLVLKRGFPNLNLCNKRLALKRKQPPMRPVWHL